MIKGEGGTMNQSEIRHISEVAIDSDLKFLIEETVHRPCLKMLFRIRWTRILLLMVEGEGFQKRIYDMIDAELRSLVREVAIKTSGAGPGRGHVGKSPPQNQPEPSRTPVSQGTRT